MAGISIPGRPRGATAPASALERAPDTLPEDWTSETAGPPPPRPGSRDLSLDLIRGLAMVVLIFNHTAVVSGIEYATGAVLSAAEILVAVSGVVVGMVFGRRWLAEGAGATTIMLLKRARKLYLASVAVVVIVGALSLLPGLATDALAISPSATTAGDSYAFESVPRLLLAIITLEAGPWQFNILGFFIVCIAAAPLVLRALEGGRWPLVLAASVGLWWLERELHPDLFPMQSERPFPLLAWQVLFVAGIVIGWYRLRIVATLCPYRRPIGAAVAVCAGLVMLAIVAGQLLVGTTDFEAWERANIDRGTMDPGRIALTWLLVAAVYLVFRRLGPRLRGAAETLLLPLGQNSFYVFIMHVFVCLAIASVPLLAGGGPGLAVGTVIELACLAAIWLMVSRRFLFRWVPR